MLLRYAKRFAGGTASYGTLANPPVDGAAEFL